MKNSRARFIGESIANSVSHGCGAAVVLAASPSLLVASYSRGGTVAVVGASIFAGAALLLYLASTLYHALPPGTTKRVFWHFDHCAIFLLIAGTYTPFTLGVLRGPWGWSLFGAVWGLALAGVLLNVLSRRHMEWITVGLYLAMGWLVLIAVVPLLRHVPPPGIVLLLAGGLAYTLGVVFYAWDRLPYFHFAWHLFVLAGTALHYFAVRDFAA